MCSNGGTSHQIVLPRPHRPSHTQRECVSRTWHARLQRIAHTTTATATSAQDKVKQALDALLARLHVLVIGPGLGREPYMQNYAKVALDLARARAMFLVLDADALWLVGQDTTLVKGYRRAVLTPNVVEFKRLCERVGVGVGGDAVPPGERAREVSKRLGGVVLLEKGPKDVVAIDTTGEAASLAESKIDIAQGGEEKEKINEVIEVDVEGGLKRCGGQGDVLSGAVGAMLAWGKCYEDGAFG